jgi:hypothetical protein
MSVNSGLFMPSVSHTPDGLASTVDIQTDPLPKLSVVGQFESRPVVPFGYSIPQGIVSSA